MDIHIVSPETTTGREGETWSAIGQGFKKHALGDRELAGCANSRSDFGRTKREQWYGGGMRRNATPVGFVAFQERHDVGQLGSRE